MIEFCGNCSIGAETQLYCPGSCAYHTPRATKRCINHKPLPGTPVRERVVYIASPLHGDIERNLQRATEYCRATSESGAIPIAPHLYLSLFLNDRKASERKAGMDMGMKLLLRCDELWVFGEPSEGMKAEIKEAERLRKPINYIPEKLVQELDERSTRI